MVMNLGEAVEYRSRDAIFAAPEHPYTRTLFAATPQINIERIRNRVRQKADMRA
jgi:dipeptide transport system ATP-binding protein